MHLTRRTSLRSAQRLRGQAPYVQRPLSEERPNERDTTTKTRGPLLPLTLDFYGLYTVLGSDPNPNCHRMVRVPERDRVGVLLSRPKLHVYFAVSDDLTIPSCIGFVRVRSRNCSSNHIRKLKQVVAPRILGFYFLDKAPARIIT